MTKPQCKSLVKRANYRPDKNTDTKPHRVENLEVTLCLLPRPQRNGFERPPDALPFPTLGLRFAPLIKPFMVTKKDERDEKRNN